jgi:hypothetical protein
MISRIGGKSSWLGTGRVLSLRTTQALVRPRATWASGGAAMGAAKAAATANAGWSSAGGSRGPRTPTKPGVSGTHTGSP